MYNLAMINDLLAKIGLNQKEIVIYLELVRVGKADAGQLCRLTKINRTTVYSVTKELVGKGFISEDLGQKPSLYIALPPEELQTLIQKQERDLETKKVLIRQTIDELKPLTKEASYPIPRIRYVPDEDIEDFLFKRSPVWDQSILSTGAKAWWGFQDHRLVEKYQKWIEWHDATRLKGKIAIKLISDKRDLETDVSKRNFEMREIKYWDRWPDFTASTLICGDYVIMGKIDEEPNYLVEIHDKTLAHNMRELFKGIWEKI